MRKVHEKSIVLGIGIGMILTSIAGMIYSAGINKEPSKQEIISLAKGYGMVERVPILPNDGGTGTGDSAAKSTAAESTVPESTAADSHNEKKSGSTTSSAVKESNQTQQSQTASKSNKIVSLERKIPVVIRRGYKSTYVADLLYSKGIINSKSKFISVIKSYKATTLIIADTYYFKKNEDIDYVIKTICDPKRLKE